MKSPDPACCSDCMTESVNNPLLVHSAWTLLLLAQMPQYLSGFGLDCMLVSILENGKVCIVDLHRAQWTKP